MTLAAIKSTGLGRLRQRIRLEGLPIDLVSSEAMEIATDASGRERLCCLSRPITKITEKVNPIDVIATGSGAQIKVADVGEKIAGMFGMLPTKSTWLLADLTAAATSATVAFSGDWSANDIAYIGMETVQIGAVVSGALNSLDRGHWASAARAHYTADGEEARYVEITDKPRTFVGRHAWLYLYGDGDDPQGDGTLVWTGVLSADPMLEADGVTWSVKIGPTTTVMGQTLGVGLGEPVSPRGAHYTPAIALRIEIRMGATADKDGTYFTDQATVVIGDPDPVHYETQQDFCNDLTDKITTAISGFAAPPRIRAIPDPILGWRLAVTINDTTARYVYVSGGGFLDSSLEPRLLDDSGALITTVATSDDATVGWQDRGVTIPGLRTIPRGKIGGAFRRTPGAETSPAGPAGLRVYVATDSPLPAAGDSVVIAWDRGEPATVSASVASVDSTVRSILLTDPSFDGVYFTRDVRASLTYGHTYATDGSVADLVAALVADSATEVNRGLAPAVTAQDFDTAVWASVVAEAAAGRPYLVGRTYRNGGEITIEDMIKAELASVGLMTGFDAQGQIIPIVLRTYVSTDGDIATLSPVGRVPRPTFAPKALGALRGAIVKTGYVPTEDDWSGPTVRMLDARANSQNPAAALLDIEPRSDWGVRADLVSDIREAMRPLLGLMGSAYSMRRVTSGLQAMDYLLGAGLSVTHEHALNWETGERDGAAFVGTVLGREVDIESGLVTLDLLVPGEAYVGWAPALGVTNQADNGGDLWDLTVQFGDPWSVDVTWSGDAVGDHYAASDAVEVYEVGVASPTVLTGTVQAGMTATVLPVLFSGAWTPGSSKWIVRPQTAGSVTASQEAYCHLADDTRQIAFSTPVSARVVGP